MENLIRDIDILEKDETCDTIEVSQQQNTGKRRKLYIESYGCQMNFSDSEIVASILNDHGFGATHLIEEADLVFLFRLAGVVLHRNDGRRHGVYDMVRGRGA